VLREHLSQRVEIQVLQVDQVGPQPGAVDHLSLEGVIQLNRGDEVLSNQERAELFRHEEADSMRLP
jgi:hypothetical protein